MSFPASLSKVSSLTSRFPGITLCCEEGLINMSHFELIKCDHVNIKINTNPYLLLTFAWNSILRQRNLADKATMWPYRSCKFPWEKNIRNRIVSFHKRRLVQSSIFSRSYFCVLTWLVNARLCLFFCFYWSKRSKHSFHHYYSPREPPCLWHCGRICENPEHSADKTETREITHNRVKKGGE